MLLSMAVDCVQVGNDESGQLSADKQQRDGEASTGGAQQSGEAHSTYASLLPPDASTADTDQAERDSLSRLRSRSSFSSVAAAAAFLAPADIRSVRLAVPEPNDTIVSSSAPPPALPATAATPSPDGYVAPQLTGGGVGPDGDDDDGGVVDVALDSAWPATRDLEAAVDVASVPEAASAAAAFVPPEEHDYSRGAWAGSRVAEGLELSRTFSMLSSAQTWGGVFGVPIGEPGLPSFAAPSCWCTR